LRIVKLLSQVVFCFLELFSDCLPSFLCCFGQLFLSALGVLAHLVDDLVESSAEDLNSLVYLSAKLNEELPVLFVLLLLLLSHHGQLLLGSCSNGFHSLFKGLLEGNFTLHQLFLNYHDLLLESLALRAVFLLRHELGKSLDLLVLKLCQVLESSLNLRTYRFHSVLDLALNHLALLLDDCLGRVLEGIVNFTKVGLHL